MQLRLGGIRRAACSNRSHSLGQLTNANRNTRVISTVELSTLDELSRLNLFFSLEDRSPKQQTRLPPDNTLLPDKTSFDVSVNRSAAGADYTVTEQPTDIQSAYRQLSRLAHESMESIQRATQQAATLLTDMRRETHLLAESKAHALKDTTEHVQQAAAQRLDTLSRRIDTQLAQLQDHLTDFSSSLHIDRSQQKGVVDAALKLHQMSLEQLDYLRTAALNAPAELENRVRAAVRSMPNLNEETQCIRKAAGYRASVSPSASSKQSTQGIEQPRMAGTWRHIVQRMSQTHQSFDKRASALWERSVTELSRSRLMQSVQTSVGPISYPSLTLTGAQRVWAIILGAVVVIGVCILWVVGERRTRRVRAERKAQELAVSGVDLDRQRMRFRKALGSAVDASVFAAVQRKGTSLAGGNDTQAFEEEEDVEEEVEITDATTQPVLTELVNTPEAWDEDTRKAWQSFIKGSKVAEGRLWDANDVDEGLPQVYVDLNE